MIFICVRLNRLHFHECCPMPLKQTSRHTYTYSDIFNLNIKVLKEKTHCKNIWKIKQAHPKLNSTTPQHLESSPAVVLISCGVGRGVVGLRVGKTPARSHIKHIDKDETQHNIDDDRYVKNVYQHRKTKIQVIQ